MIEHDIAIAHREVESGFDHDIRQTHASARMTAEFSVPVPADSLVRDVELVGDANCEGRERVEEEVVEVIVRDSDDHIGTRGCELPRQSLVRTGEREPTLIRGRAHSSQCRGVRTAHRRDKLTHLTRRLRSCAKQRPPRRLLPGRPPRSRSRV